MPISLLHRLIWFFFRPLTALAARQIVLGQERIRALATPFIVVANHESHLDPFLISGAMPFRPFRSPIIPIRFFTRDIFFAQPVFGRILRLLGAFPGKIGYGLDEAAAYPVDLLRRGTSVGIFPEWCFPDEPESSRMQMIAPHIAKRANRPIVPVFLFGIQGLTWSKLLRGRTQLIVTYGRPLWFPPDEPIEAAAERLSRGLLAARLECIHYLRGNEQRFWESYARFYSYLELAEPFRRLKRAISSLLPDQPRGRWLDLGTGSGAMVDLITAKNSHGLREIIATDFNDNMLSLARARFAEAPLVRVEKLDLARALPYASGALDGVTANLVLPYIVNFEGAVGRHALTRVLGEIFRVLRPGGFFLWSAPRKRVNFSIVALASWRSFLAPERPEYRSYAWHILRHARRIQAWGRRGIYHFLSLTELETLLYEIGFRGLEFRTSLAGQVYVVTGRRPSPRRRRGAPKP